MLLMKFKFIPDIYSNVAIHFKLLFNIIPTSVTRICSRWLWSWFNI